MFDLAADAHKAPQIINLMRCWHKNGYQMRLRLRPMLIRSTTSEF